MVYSEPSVIRSLETVRENLSEISREVQSIASNDAVRQNALQKCLELLQREDGKHLIESYDNKGMNSEGYEEIILYGDIEEVDHSDLINEIKEALNPSSGPGTLYLYTFR